MLRAAAYPYLSESVHALNRTTGTAQLYPIYRSDESRGGFFARKIESLKRTEQRGDRFGYFSKKDEKNTKKKPSVTHL
jgi:hypothetical protein